MNCDVWLLISSTWPRIDDFGTGFSSLSYLLRFPVDELKIDKSFVSKIGHADKDASLVRAIIGIGHDLQLKVVAEGVETLEQATSLAARGCNLLQGYYLAQALPLTAWLPLALASASLRYSPVLVLP